MRLLKLTPVLLFLAPLLAAQEESPPKPKPAPAAQESPQEAKPDAGAKVKELQEALAVVATHGKAASTAVSKARKDQEMAAAAQVLRHVGRELNKLEAPDASPAANAGADQQIEQAVDRLSSRIAEVISLGESALPALSAALAPAKGLEKSTFQSMKDQIFIQSALAEIKLYDGGGTFDGMFPKLEKFGADGAKAFMSIFGDPSHPLSTRELAGEGVAQLGSKDQLADVKSVYDDQLEDQRIRGKAKEILGRLGDTSLIDKDLAMLDQAIAELEDKLAKAQPRLQELQAKRQKLMGAEAPEGEATEEIRKLEKELNEAMNEVVGLIDRIARAHLQKAYLYQGMRLHAKTEETYKKALEYFRRIAPYIERDPGSRQAVNNAFYNLACVQSLQKNIEPALKSLDQAFRWGFNDFDWASTDGDLANIRKDPKFKELLAEVKSGKAKERWRKEAEARKLEMEKAAEAEKQAEDQKAAEKTAESGEEKSGEKKSEPSGGQATGTGGTSGT